MSQKNHASASSSAVLWQQAKRKSKEGGRYLKHIVFRHNDHNIHYEKLICGMLLCSQALIMEILTEISELVGNNRKKKKQLPKTQNFAGSSVFSSILMNQNNLTHTV